METIYAVQTSAYNRNGLVLEGETYMENSEDALALVDMIESSAESGEWTLTKNCVTPASTHVGPAFGRAQAKALLDACAGKILMVFSQN